MSSGQSTTDTESLQSIYESVTGDDDGVLTEEQEMSVSHEPVDEETQEITDAISENVGEDGLDEAVEGTDSGGNNGTD